jgi:hypothetical protein
MQNQPQGLFRDHQPDDNFDTMPPTESLDPHYDSEQPVTHVDATPLSSYYQQPAAHYQPQDNFDVIPPTQPLGPYYQQPAAHYQPQDNFDAIPPTQPLGPYYQQPAAHYQLLGDFDAADDYTSLPSFNPPYQPYASNQQQQYPAADAITVLATPSFDSQYASSASSPYGRYPQHNQRAANLQQQNHIFSTPLTPENFQHTANSSSKFRSSFVGSPPPTPATRATSLRSRASKVSKASKALKAIKPHRGGKKITAALLKDEAPKLGRVFTWSQDVQLGDIFADHTPWLDIVSPAKYRTLVEERIDETFVEYREEATEQEVQALNLETSTSSKLPSTPSASVAYRWLAIKLTDLSEPVGCHFTLLLVLY